MLISFFVSFFTSQGSLAHFATTVVDDHSINNYSRSLAVRDTESPTDTTHPLTSRRLSPTLTNLTTQHQIKHTQNI